MRRHSSRRRIACAACLLLALFSFPIPTLAASSQGQLAHHPPAQHMSAQPGWQSWHIVSSPNVGTVGSQLSGVSAVSASDIWAVGFSYTNLYSNLTLTEHWNGSTWQVVPSPNVGNDVNYLYAASALAANNVWAVGSYRSGVLRTLIEHWNGSQWSVVPSSNVGPSHNQLEDIVALAPTNVWAVGTYFNLQDPRANFTLIEHWNGSQWSVVPSPNTTEGINILLAVSAVSANNIWAAGFYYDLNHHRDATLIEHWNGAIWSIVPSPNDGQDFCRLLAVTAVSANDIWAVGDDTSTTPIYNGTGTFTFIEHWNGSRWEIIKSKNPGNGFNSLDAALAASGKVWAVGYYFNNQAKNYETLAELHS